MFTGIIEEIGTVREVRSGKLKIAACKVLDSTQIGDSIAVNGVCLTVTSMVGGEFTADVMPETLRRSNLGELHSGSRVNLERAAAVGSRLGGHIVSGHIDGTGAIRSIKREGNAVWVTVSADSNILELIVEKGSIAIDGISLTVAAVTDRDFSVSLIPHTGEATTLLSKRAGEIVNLENDIIGKYVKKLMSVQKNQEGGLTLEFLQTHGF